MSALRSIRLAAAEKAFRAHVSARAWHRHCAEAGHPLHGKAEAQSATSRYERIRALVERREGVRIVAGTPA